MHTTDAFQTHQFNTNSPAMRADGKHTHTHTSQSRFVYVLCIFNANINLLSSMSQFDSFIQIFGSLEE